MKVHELVARFAKVGESANPMNAAREELEALRGDIDAVEQASRFVSGWVSSSRIASMNRAPVCASASGSKT